MNKIIIGTVSLFLICTIQLNAQKREGINKIKNSYDLTKLTELEDSYRRKNVEEKQKANRMATLNGWKKKIVFQNGSYAELQRVTDDGKPIYYSTYNIDASVSTRTNYLNSGGGLGLNLNGNDMIAHVWDAGLARASHQEYDGTGGSNRFSNGDGTTALHFHAAHVTGTIMASGVDSNAKGMAPHCEVIGYDWNSDQSEATNAASNGMLISNHSYGLAQRDAFGNPILAAYFFGGYIAESKNWDDIMFNAPHYLMVVAAGNSGNDDTVNDAPLNGNANFDKLTGHSTSKNSLVVANAQDAVISSNGDLVSAVINISSSEGPTDDLRIKPDITGNGTGVYSTFDNFDSSYSNLTGTSMATPNVSGSLLLLQEHWYDLNAVYMKSATLKGLALHTADDLGAVGPDAIFGWGLLNAKRAIEVINSEGNESIIEERVLNAGSSYSFTVESDGVNPLLASISWTDRSGTATTVANSSTPVLVNDLDIRVTKTGSTHFPYRLLSENSTGTGDNIVDPYERVDVNNASGTYTITVSHKGTLTGGSQNYSLIVSGISNMEVVGSSLVCNSSQTFSLNNSPGGSISWQVSSNLQIHSSSNTAITVSAINSSASGTGYIRAVSPSVTSQKDVWVGKPATSLARTYEYCQGKYHYITFEANSNGSSSSYNWNYFAPPGSNFNEYGNILEARLPKMFQGYMEVSVSVTNACGSGGNFFDEYIKKCGTFVNQPPFNANISPNPAGSIINVLTSFEDENDVDVELNYEIYDVYGVRIYSKKHRNKSIKINTNRLKEGFYILILSNGEDKISKPFIIKH